MGRMLLGAVASVACMAGAPAIAQPADYRPGWSFQLAPYLWLPTVNGTLRYGLPSNIGGTADVKADAGDYVANLNAALVLAGEARYGRFSVFTDIMYISASAGGSSVRDVDIAGVPRNPISSTANLGTSTNVSTASWSLAAGYTVANGTWGNVDLFGGFRWFRVDADTDYNLNLQLFGPRGTAGPSFGGGGRLSGNDNIFDGIVGVRGRLRLGESNFFVPYYLDIGAGSSRFTWQGFAGLGYQSGWAGVQIGYRYLSMEGSGSDLIQDLSLGGAYLAVNFSF